MADEIHQRVKRGLLHYLVGTLSCSNLDGLTYAHSERKSASKKIHSFSKCIKVLLASFANRVITSKLNSKRQLKTKAQTDTTIIIENEANNAFMHLEKSVFRASQ